MSNTATIIIYNRKGVEVARTIVDAEDYEAQAQYQWRYTGGYAQRSVACKPKKISVTLHRALLNAPEGMEVDHINGNRLDNRRSNLRLCTPEQNRMNRGKHKNTKCRFLGVYWDESASKYKASIYFDHKLRHLGLFECEEDAARHRDAVALQLRGEFARLNFPITT